MSLSSEVASFARSRLGTQVGRGECWDLAEEALRSSGARTSGDFGRARAGNYVWGTPIPLSAIQPGDIIQFRSYRLTIETTTVGDDGSSNWEEATLTRGAPNHTAIVATVNSNGSVEVLEQNVSGHRRVLSNTLYFANARTERRRSGNRITTNISVSGTWVFYRPQARPPQE